MGAAVRAEIESGRAAARALLGGARVGFGGVRLPDLPGAWTAFDEEVRRVHSRSYPPPPGDRLATRLCDPDGRVREAALRDPKAPLPLVAIRCADWVPAVRDLARQVLAGALAADPGRTLTGLVSLVLRLGRREQGGWALELFDTALRAEEPVLAPWARPARPARWGRPARPAHTLTGEVPDTVMAWLRRSGDLPVRRYAARLTLDSGLFGVRELARRAAVESDPLTSRLWAEAAMTAMAADGPDDEAIDALLGGHVPMVRACGVTALRGAGRAAEAARHLTDRSALVRACARWAVTKAGGDPYALCRELVEDPARVFPYAVTGFSECAGRADAPLLRALLDHPAGAVRAAALAGLRRVAGPVDVERLLPLLDDPSASVVREAALCLLPAAVRLDASPLEARVGADRPAHTRRAAFRLLRAGGGAPALRASRALAGDPDPALRALALRPGG
ncbi:HEAT repeat domain-containing protein [Streptomyces goshikiensis]|uniref:HEAT repeat domain-containing protein n=2 Tax=Streptomyces goshikiensis TaxID=1942 RepID=UPI003660FC0A